VQGISTNHCWNVLKKKNTNAIKSRKKVTNKYKYNTIYNMDKNAGWRVFGQRQRDTYVWI
jgi:hypothetical protein